MENKNQLQPIQLDRKKAQGTLFSYKNWYVQRTSELDLFIKSKLNDWERKFINNIIFYSPFGVFMTEKQKNIYVKIISKYQKQ